MFSQLFLSLAWPTYYKGGHFRGQFFSQTVKGYCKKHVQITAAPEVGCILYENLHICPQRLCHSRGFKVDPRGHTYMGYAHLGGQVTHMHAQCIPLCNIQGVPIKAKKLGAHLMSGLLQGIIYRYQRSLNLPAIPNATTSETGESNFHNLVYTTI